jgi:hypothetical protein
VRGRKGQVSHLIERQPPAPAGQESARGTFNSVVHLKPDAITGDGVLEREQAF